MRIGGEASNLTFKLTKSNFFAFELSEFIPRLLLSSLKVFVFRNNGIENSLI